MKKNLQRHFMLDLIEQYGPNEELVVSEYAKAERRGQVERKKNKSGYTPEQYARRLWQDGVRKKWISGVE